MDDLKAKYLSLIADAVATGAPTFVITPEPARLLSAMSALAPHATSRWLTTGGNRTIAAPPPNPAAVISSLVEGGVATETPYGAALHGACDLVTAQRQSALTRVVSLLR